MKNKFWALFLSAVLCVTATPVTGMAAEFSNDTAAAETSEKDMNEESEELPGQEETGEDISDDADIIEYKEESEASNSEELEQTYETEDTETFSDTGDAFSDGEVPENGNIILSHEGIIQEGAINPKKTSAVLTEEWEQGLIELVENNGTVLDISALSIPADQISDIVMLFINRHPEYYWLSFESCDVENGIAVTLYEVQKPSMGKSEDEMYGMYGSWSLEKATKDALSGISPEMNDVEKALVLYEYLKLHTAFDYENYKNDSVPESSYTIEGALVNGKAVCQGFTLAYGYLLNKVNIENKYVTSSTMKSCWNMVKIDGEWYHVDTTWELHGFRYNTLGWVSHLCFMISDKLNIQYAHSNWESYDSDPVPVASSNKYDNYFWQFTNTSIWYQDGKWYYMNKNGINCREIYDTSERLIKKLSIKWHSVGDSAYDYWDENYAKLMLCDGYLYYNEPDAIYRFDLDKFTTKKVAKVKYIGWWSEIYAFLYGFAYLQGRFWIEAQTDPYIYDLGDIKEIRVIDLEMPPMEEVTPTPTVTPTPKPTATPKPTVTPTKAPAHTPVVPNVTESVLNGLSSPLKFYPNKFYSFTVIGAGTTNKKPGEGDIKWKPVYWSTSANPNDHQKNREWKIGSAKGITKQGTYNMYVFFKKCVYTGGKWIETDTIKSASYQFQSADIQSVKLSTPSLSGTSNSAAGVVVKWKQVKNASGYKIYRKTGSTGKWSSIAKVTGSKTLIYTDGSAKHGTTYTYSVCAYKGSSVSAYNKTGSKIIRLQAPVQYTPSSKTSGKITAKWKKVSSVSGYQIQYSDSKSFAGAKTVSSNGAAKTISGLKKGKTYYVRVRTYKKTGGKTYYSAWGSTKTVKVRK